ncbi:MAG: hypothetical protein J6N15_11615 [Ruminiclostridium sp.]|nr:hypothetical protein [Ruminiclostridium sp.]
MYISALGHAYINGSCIRCGTKEPAKYFQEKEPTCTEHGNKEHYRRDSYYYTDSECTQPTTRNEITIPALGHDYENGVCTRCGAQELGEAVITLSQTECIYTGKPCTPGFTVRDKKTDKLVPLSCYKAEYKNNVEVGTASLVLTMSAPYSGTYTENFVINYPAAKNIADITLAHNSYIFVKGTVYCPKVTVTDKDGYIVPDVYYSVEYKDNTAVGTATVTVTAILFHLLIIQ